MPRKIVFDDVSSFIHFILGCALYYIARYLPVVTVVATASYIAYQVVERERGLNKLGDFIEFIMGALVGLIL